MLEKICGPSGAAEAIGQRPLGEFLGEVSIELAGDPKWKILGIFSNPGLRPLPLVSAVLGNWGNLPQKMGWKKLNMKQAFGTFVK